MKQKHRIHTQTQRSKAFFLVLFMIYGSGCFSGYVTHKLFCTQHPKIVKSSNASVCFTPDKQCQQLILDQIVQATKSIRVHGYSFTDIFVARGLANAHLRGIDVKIILDKSNRTNRKSAKYVLTDGKIPVRIDSPAGIAHNKIIIIDEHIVLTGSYNYSEGAWKRNTENLLLLDDATLAKKYLENWQKRWEVSSDILPFSFARQNKPMR